MTEHTHEQVQLRDHRLEEALESLDQGFSLWDADDRLLICNSCYRSLYPTVSELMVPGANFEELVRIALERGQFPVHGNAHEAWLRERVRDHRNPPDEPFEQRLADGRWILVVERRTPSGHTVGTRVDITERKKLEIALARLASVSSVPGLNLQRRIEEVLKLGVHHFDMPFGVMTRTDGRELVVSHCVTPGDEFRSGDRMPLADTFCARALRGGLTLDVVSENCDEDPTHPFMQRYGFRSYLGTPYVVDHDFEGTVCFFSQHERTQQVPEGARELLRLLARWVGNEVERERTLEKLDAARAGLQRLATTDALTGLLNRRALLDFGNAEFHRARRYGNPLCALAVDVDHFKGVNDSFGHAAGDRVLQQVAASCQGSVRDHDGAGRTGGEEFALVLIEADAERAREIAERTRQAVAALSFESGARVSVSIGVAQAHADDEDFEALLARADSALYLAKELGRNQVQVAAT